MSRVKVLALVSVVAILAVITSAVAVTHAYQIRGRQTQMLNGLTDEQIAEIIQKIKEMRKNGATLQEIKAAVTAMLRGWGIQVNQIKGGLMLRLFRRIALYYLLHHR